MHGTFTDTLAINPAFLERIEGLFPGRDYRGRRRQAARPRHLVHQVRPRRRPDHRPHQPLQHDVRSVLHGRQPGRLRPRADARRREAAPGRCDRHQAQAADDGAVLGRRADDLSDLPGRRALRARGRATSACRRRPTASASPRMPPFARAGARGRASHRLPAVRRRGRGAELPPQGREPVRREAARDRESLRRRHRRLPRRHDRQDRQRRPGRADREVRPGELRQDQLRLVPAGVVHRPRRGDFRRASVTPSATHCRISPKT